MRRSPARERAAAPARRLEVLESLGREDEEEEEEEVVVVVVEGSGEMRAALWRMAFSEVK
jgi:hypothetical protein